MSDVTSITDQQVDAFIAAQGTAACETDLVGTERARFAIKAGLAAALAAQFQGIEIYDTEKHGTEVLAYHSGIFMGAMVLTFYDGRWHDKNSGEVLKSGPHFFMTLPAPPATQEKPHV